MNRNITHPQLLLRLEGLAAFALALLIYAEVGASWWLFVVLFFVPDLSLLGYLAGSRIGAILYNAVHTYVLPAALFGFGFVAERQLAMALGLIWAAHIAADRLLLFGLKYQAGFRETHLHRVA
jgi:hypothetical protein